MTIGLLDLLDQSFAQFVVDQGRPTIASFLPAQSFGASSVVLDCAFVDLEDFPDARGRGLQEHGLHVGAGMRGSIARAASKPL
jgi:hypothetical protein